MSKQAKLYPLLVDEEEAAGLDRPRSKEFRKPMIDVDRIRDELRDIKSRLVGVFDDQDVGGGFGLSSLEISVAIGVEGGIAFISKGSVEGSITLTFSRPK